VDRSTGLICDQTIRLTGTSAQDRPAHLRRIAYCDPETGKKLDFLTHDFTLLPLTITELYRQRWQVELFAKWIKQYLRIKAFYGTSAHAVKPQIWIAISIFLLMAIVRSSSWILRDVGDECLLLIFQWPSHQAILRIQKLAGQVCCRWYDENASANASGCRKCM
jgi:hypothetical protein